MASKYVKSSSSSIAIKLTPLSYKSNIDNVFCSAHVTGSDIFAKCCHISKGRFYIDTDPTERRKVNCKFLTTSILCKNHLMLLRNCRLVFRFHV